MWESAFKRRYRRRRAFFDVLDQEEEFAPQPYKLLCPSLTQSLENAPRLVRLDACGNLPLRSLVGRRLSFRTDINLRLP